MFLISITQSSTFLFLQMAVVIFLSCLTAYRVTWATCAFISAVPMISGIQMIGWLPGAKLIEIGFASIFIVWLPKRILCEQRQLGESDYIDNLADIFSFVVLLSMVFVLASWAPVDFLIDCLWRLKVGNINDPLFTFDAAWIILQGIFLFRIFKIESKVNLKYNTIVAVFLIHAITIIGFSLSQWVFSIKPLYFQGLYGIYLPFSDIHSYASYTLSLFFIFIFLGFKNKKYVIRYANLLMAFLFLIFCIMTGSNSIILSFFSIALILVFKYFNKKAVMLVGLIISAFVLLLFYVPSHIDDSSVPIIKRYSRILLLTKLKETQMSRFILWERAWNMIKSYPLTGHGIGSYYRLSTFYQNPNEKQNSGWKENTHNYFLQIASEIGIIGLILFLLILITTLYVGIMSMTKIEENKSLVMGLVLGAISYMITMITGHPLLLSNQQFCFWFIIAAIGISSNMEYSILNTKEKR